MYNLKTKSYRAIDTGYTSHTFVNVGGNGHVYCVAGSPTKFSCVVQINTQTGKVSLWAVIIMMSMFFVRSNIMGINFLFWNFISV